MAKTDRKSAALWGAFAAAAFMATSALLLGVAVVLGPGFEVS